VIGYDDCGGVFVSADYQDEQGEGDDEEDADDEVGIEVAEQEGLFCYGHVEDFECFLMCLRERFTLLLEPAYVGVISFGHGGVAYVQVADERYAVRGGATGDVSVDE